jgi:HlyD family secretion protein
MALKQEGILLSKIGKPKINNTNFKKISTKKRIGIFGIIFVLLIAGVFLLTHFIKTNAAANSSKNTIQTTKVQKGEISTSISGSGPVTSSTTINVAPQVSSTVTAVNVKEGDTVKAGDLLFEMDDTDSKSKLVDAENTLLQNSLENKSTVSNIESLNVTAPFSGQIKNLNAEIGGTVNSNQAIMALIDTSKLKATLSFSDAKVKNVKVGTSATVYSQDFMDTLTGKVTYVSSTPYSTTSGGDIYSVDIEINNPGALQSGMAVSAEIKTSQGTIESTESAALKYVTQTTIKSSAGGTVISLNARENEYVKKGELLVKLENDNVVNSKLASEIKTKSLQTQVEDAEKQVGNCKVYAAMDGLITKVNIKNGDSVKAGDTAMTLANYNSLQVEIDVDELDIENVKVGQEAEITVDAIKETQTKPLTGKVSKIAVEGTSNNGVTTYPVTILIDKSDKLKGGMNVNAEVFISKKSDILYVPIQSVIKRGNNNYVMVSSDAQTIAEMKKNGTYIDLFSGNNFGGMRNSSSGSGYSSNNSSTKNNSTGNSSTRNNGTGSSSVRSSGTWNSSTRSSTKSSTKTTSTMTKYKEYYANAYPVLVELGVNNETNIEIVSGVKEGDTIVLPPTTSSSASTTYTQQQGGAGGAMGIGGNAGGGMPPEGGGPRN